MEKAPIKYGKVYTMKNNTGQCGKSLQYHGIRILLKKLVFY